MNWTDRKKLYDAEYFDSPQQGQRFRKWWWESPYVWEPRARVICEGGGAKSVLVCGCAMGSLVHFIKRIYHIDCYGFDLSEEAIGSTPFPEDDKYMLVLDAATEVLPFEDGYFDVSVAFDFFEHQDDEHLDMVIESVKRVTERMIILRQPIYSIPPRYSRPLLENTYGLPMQKRWVALAEAGFNQFKPNPDDIQHPSVMGRKAILDLFAPEFEQAELPLWCYDVRMGAKSDQMPVLPFYDTMVLERNDGDVEKVKS
jgi:SAM-dependent methyltransferase